MRDIGKNIRDLRESKGLTQEELAARLFVTRHCGGLSCICAESLRHTNMRHSSFGRLRSKS